MLQSTLGRIQRSARFGLAGSIVLLALWAGAGSSASTLAATPAQAAVRLPGHVLPALAQATRVAASSRAASAESQPLTLTVVLNRRDEKGFQKYLADVENLNSPNHLKFLTQQQLTDRYGPSQASYDAVLAWLKSQGFTLSEGSANRLTSTVKGTRAQAEQAFQVNIGDYKLKDRSFYANDQEPAVPGIIAGDIEAIQGLTNLAQPQSNRQQIVANPIYQCLVAAAKEQIDGPLKGSTELDWLLEILSESVAGGAAIILAAADNAAFCEAAITLAALNCLAAGYNNPGFECKFFGDPPLPSGPTGAGQKVGLLEFDSYHVSDVRDWLQFAALSGLSGLSPTQLGQVSQVPVNGGVAPPGSGEPEVLIDIDAALAVAPGANVVVYDGSGSTTFQAMFNAMLSDPSGSPNVIANSWSYCEDQTTLADVQSLDSILESAAASGISVFNASGDTGSSCLDGSPNTVGVPADSPHATAVGGTRLTPNSAFTYGSEAWWDGSQSRPRTGQGGFGTSRFFSRPTYQAGLTSSSMRSVPDVAANADPAAGFTICQADAGGCPTGLLYGGTSLAAPEWAAMAAVLNQAQGQNLGLLNPLIYPLAQTAGFHSAASMGSDFGHVGLGSPDLSQLSLALRRAAVGPVSSTASGVSVVGPFMPADGATPATVVVQLRDANGNSVSDESVQLATNSGSHAVIAPVNGVTNVSNGAALFQVTDNTIEPVTFTTTDTTDNVVLQQTATIDFVSPLATTGGISAQPTSVANDGKQASTITITLLSAKGQGASGKMVTLSQGTGRSTITGPTPRVTDPNGQVTFSVTDTTAETVTYMATDVTDGSLPVPGSAQVTFGSGQGSVPCSNGTPAVAPGYAVTVFASGFPYGFGCIGPVGLAFDSSGNLYVSDFPADVLYEFGPHGGTADASTALAQLPTSNGGNGVVSAGLAFSKDGQHLYLGRSYLIAGQFLSGNGDVLELDPATGAIVRTVAVGGGVFGLATDPLSGDLFAAEGNKIVRISNPEGSAPSTSAYASPGGTDGITFGPDGTLYTETNGGVDEIAGTNAAQPGAVTVVTSVPGGPDGIAIAAQQPPFLFVNRNDGTITKVDPSTNPPTLSTIYSGGTRGDFVAVGPDGCLYATQTTTILKVTNVDGTCPFAPTSALPQLGLSPLGVSPNPATGTSVTFTATLHNVPNPQGTLVNFSVTGANPQTQEVAADANGRASFTYVGAHTGADSISATATAGTASLTSNTAGVTWVAGKDVTFLDLNTSQTSGAQNVPATLAAQLTDVSQSPATPLSGQPLVLGIGSGPSTQTCQATTDSTGTGSCALTPTQPPGLYALTASYAGSSLYTAASAQASFSITSLMPTSLSYTGATSVNSQGQAALSAVLMARVGGPLAGKSVGFSLGSGASQETCSGTTDGTGTASCSIAVSGQPGGSVPIAASFDGDSSDAASFAQASFTACGEGDVNCDLKVDATDALCILRVVAGLPTSSACPNPLPNPQKIATDGNATLDATDALCVLRHVANLPATNACPAWGSQPAGTVGTGDSGQGTGATRAAGQPAGPHPSPLPEGEGASQLPSEISALSPQSPPASPPSPRLPSPSIGRGAGGEGQAPAGLGLAPSTVSAEQSKQTTVTLTFDGSPITDHGSSSLGSWTVDVRYDPQAVKVTGCEAAAGGICNANYAPGVVRIVGASTSGVSSGQDLATLTFQGAGSTGSSPVSAAAVTLASPQGDSLAP